MSLLVDDEQSTRRDLPVSFRPSLPTRRCLPPGFVPYGPQPMATLEPRVPRQNASNSYALYPRRLDRHMRFGREQHSLVDPPMAF